MTHDDFIAIWLTLKLAGVTTAVLLLIATPIAWWLAHTRSIWKSPLGALVNLPLVMPPTVLGFYLLLALGPQGPVGHFTESLGLGRLPFTFWGLVLGALETNLQPVPQRPAGTHHFEIDPLGLPRLCRPAADRTLVTEEFLDQLREREGV